MKLNEEGFIFPLTIIICFLMCVVILIQVDSYLIDKYFVYEQERKMQLESLLQVSISEFIKNHSEPVANQNYVFSYEPGNVTLEIRDYTNGLSNVIVTVTLTTGHERVAGFLYHWEDAIVENYWEVSDYATSILHHGLHGIG